MTRRTILALAIVMTCASMSFAKAPTADQLLGTWTHREGAYKTTLVFKPDGLRLSFSLPEGFRVVMDADYLVTRDGILIGALRIEKKAQKEGEGKDIQDRVFHFRLAMEGDVLIVTELEGGEVIDEDWCKASSGLYRRTDSSSATRGTRQTQAPAKQGSRQHPEAAAPASPGQAIGALLSGAAQVFSTVVPVNRYSSNPNRRIQELLDNSEDLRQIEHEWKRMWKSDQPSHLTPERVHGGIQSQGGPARSSPECRLVPVLPWDNDRNGELHIQTEKDYRTVVITGMACDDRPREIEPPAEPEILYALPKLSQGLPWYCEVFRDDVQITTEKVGSKFSPARFYPLVGQARVHSSSWKCTVYYTEVIESSFPFPFRCKKPRVDVVYLDKDHLEMCEEERERLEKKESDPNGRTSEVNSAPSSEPPLALPVLANRLVPLPPPTQAKILEVVQSNRPSGGDWMPCGDTVRMEVELLAHRVDPPRFYPLVGHAQVHHSTWKCKVNFTEAISTWGFLTFCVTRNRAEVVTIDTAHLQLCAEGPDRLKKKGSDPNERISELSGPPGESSWWDWAWWMTQPSHLTPERVHGGIQ